MRMLLRFKNCIAWHPALSPTAIPHPFAMCLSLRPLSRVPCVSGGWSSLSKSPSEVNRHMRLQVLGEIFPASVPEGHGLANQCAGHVAIQVPFQVGRVVFRTPGLSFPPLKGCCRVLQIVSCVSLFREGSGGLGLETEGHCQEWMRR